METTVLSVRALCEFLLRSGSLDNRGGAGDRLLEGARIHRRIQSKEGEHYRAEVTLRGEFIRAGRVWQIQGRADGLLETADHVTVDEIKTTALPLEALPPDGDPAHWGQAMCYAYLYASALEEEKRPALSVRLRYVQAETMEILSSERETPFSELEAFFFDLLDRYSRWADWEAAWKAARDESLRALSFPFPAYRPGQRRFAAAVYRTAASGGRLFAQAPTGIGKTVSSLFPAFKAMGEGKAEKVFYLTAKTVTRGVAEDAVRLLRDGGMRLKSVTLTAKDKICPLPERDCNPEACPFADGYYDRINDCVFTLLAERDTFTREAVEDAARTYRVCPFELSLDLSSWCDLIIGDYNHLFDPVASLKRFFSEEGEYIFLIDEAHNLVSRSREMYSAEILRREVSALRRQAKEAGEKPLFRAVGKLDAALREIRKRCEEEGVQREKGRYTLTLSAPPEDVVQVVHRFTAFCEEWLPHAVRGEVRRAALEVYFTASFFARIAEGYDERYRTLIESGPEGVQVRLLCLDASAFLRKSMELGRASVLFSATLSPLDYFREVLGGTEEDKRLTLPSPFPPSRLCLTVADRVGTRYTEREVSRPQVAALLHAFCTARQGHHLFFFPSYAYLHAVYEEFHGRYPDERTLVQSAGSEGSGDFLRAFEEDTGEALAGFCVLGGQFAEGVDLRGERLIGAAVVGVGLPQMDECQELLRAYYESMHGSGFDYAYRFPGMNKVLQAAGRVIRGEKERGAVLLIDSRFSTPAYRALFPEHWAHARRVRDEAELREELVRFWENTEP